MIKNELGQMNKLTRNEVKKVMSYFDKCLSTFNFPTTVHVAMVCQESYDDALKVVPEADKHYIIKMYVSENENKPSYCVLNSDERSLAYIDSINNKFEGGFFDCFSFQMKKWFSTFSGQREIDLELNGDSTGDNMYHLDYVMPRGSNSVCVVLFEVMNENGEPCANLSAFLPIEVAKIIGGTNVYKERVNMDKAISCARIPVDITVGHVAMTIEELKNLGNGDLIDLGIDSGSLLDISVNGNVVASGEVIDDNGRLKVRVIC